MNEYLLDTDIISILFRTEFPPQPLMERLTATSPENIWVSIVTVEEFLQGAFSLIRREETIKRGTQGYALLASLLEDLSSYQVLPFNEHMLQHYYSFPPAVRRVGSSDCKIAASAIERGLTVITRNLRHYQQIPDCVCEDWTVEAPF
ncbi:PIN domain-containing protein [Armatimonas sp.]|uniref:type II toxin-antitoxin system VapC family toxin n=1 Tax=Armatimonas sp. TaxID=1872638 RepID=UPI00286B2F35|nr:PIN domain-containing protein [Armatimonas sp.]